MGFAERFRARTSEVERSCPGRFGFAAWDLREREPVLVGERREFQAASTIKVLIMIAVLRRVRDGALEPSHEVELPEASQRAEGSGVLRDLSGLHRLSVADLITLMIVVSDNAATNALIATVGLDAIGRCARDLGCERTRVERPLMDPRARGSNVTTALDQARVLDQLATGAALPPELTRAALGVLARQQVRDRLPDSLPSTLTCWNKTGEQLGLRHDVGLIGATHPSVVVAVLVDELTDERSSTTYRGGPACPWIAGLGRAVAHAASW